jgi:site-specific recombinase XerD
MLSFNRDLKSGMIYMHLHLDGKRFRVSTKVKVSAKDWTGQQARTDKIEYGGIKINEQLKHCIAYITEALMHLTDQGGDFTQLKQYYTALQTGKRTIKKTGKEFMPYFKLEYEKQEANLTTAASHYKCTYNTLEAYLKGSTPTFDQINDNFYKSFTRWCETDKDYMVSTISSHIKWIKAVMNNAKKEGLHKNESYKDFKRKSYTVDKIALDRAELDKIANKKLSSPELAVIRDYFLLSCYTGARVSDWQQFRSIMKDSKIWEYKSNKTKENAKVKITPVIIEIMQRYNWNLPAIEANQALNENIRKVCQEAEITDMYTTSVTKGGKLVTETAERHTLVSSHTGRRTFTTNNITDGMPVHLVMLQTGHKTLASLEGYIRLKELQSTIALLDWKKPE